jgi:hypothetical protein
MTMRSVAYVGTVTLLTLGFGTLGCGSNAPATTGGAGGVASTGGATVAPSSGGATTPVTTGSGGTTTPITTGSGGTTTPITTGSGGSTTPVTTGSGGSTSGNTLYQPSCTGLTTAAGVPPAKNILCPDPADPQLCYKTCGPASVGFKSEACMSGAYVEQSGCSFLPGVDYSCYKIPAAIDPSCPATAPKASDPCTVAPCTLCNVANSYLDSTGAAKTGYCVCPAPGTSGTSKWSCASSTAWPCPAGMGC